MLTLKKLKEIEPAVFAGSNHGKKPSPQTIASTIKAIVKEFGQDPQSINSGDCDRFAEELVSRLSYGAAMETVSADEEDYDDPEDFDEDMAEVPNHAFVQIGNRYYDAETPQGVTNWWDLPVYKRFDFQESTTNQRHFLRNVPLIGSESFAEWFDPTRP